jgi:hypothetical protein
MMGGATFFVKTAATPTKRRRIGRERPSARTSTNGKSTINERKMGSGAMTTAASAKLPLVAMNARSPASMSLPRGERL